jgi:hypothetical protein
MVIFLLTLGKWVYNCHSYNFDQIDQQFVFDTIDNNLLSLLHYRTDFKDLYFNKFRYSFNVYINADKNDQFYQINSPLVITNITRSFIKVALYNTMFSFKNLFSPIFLERDKYIKAFDEYSTLYSPDTSTYQYLSNQLVQFSNKDLFKYLSYVYNEIEKTLQVVNLLQIEQELINMFINLNNVIAPENLTELSKNVLFFKPSQNALTFSELLKFDPTQVQNFTFDIGNFVNFTFLNIFYKNALQQVVYYSTQRNPFYNLSLKKVYKLEKASQTKTIPIEPATKHLISFWYNIASKSYVQLKYCFKNDIVYDEIYIKLTKSDIIEITYKEKSILKNKYNILNNASLNNSWNYMFMHFSTLVDNNLNVVELLFYFDKGFGQYDQQKLLINTDLKADAGSFKYLYTNIISSIGNDKIFNFKHFSIKSLDFDLAEFINSFRYFSNKFLNQFVLNNSLNFSEEILINHKTTSDVFILSNDALNNNELITNIFIEGYPKIILSDSDLNFYSLLVKFDGEFLLKSVKKYNSDLNLDLHFENEIIKLTINTHINDEIIFRYISVINKNLLLVLNFENKADGESIKFRINLDTYLNNALKSLTANIIQITTVVNKISELNYTAQYEETIYPTSLVLAKDNTIGIKFNDENNSNFQLSAVKTYALSHGYTIADIVKNDNNKEFKLNLYSYNDKSYINFINNISFTLNSGIHSYPQLVNISSSFNNKSSEATLKLNYKNVIASLSKDFITFYASNMIQKLELYISSNNIYDINISLEAFNSSFENNFLSVRYNYNSEANHVKVFDVELSIAELQRDSFIYYLKPFVEEDENLLGILLVKLIYEEVKLKSFNYPIAENVISVNLFLTNMLFEAFFLNNLSNYVQCEECNLQNSAERYKNLLTFEGRMEGNSSIMANFMQLTNIPIDIATEEIITVVDSCATNPLIYIKTNLRHLEDFSREVNLLSLFENKFEVFVNPLCESTCKRIDILLGFKTINLLTGEVSFCSELGLCKVVTTESKYVLKNNKLISFAISNYMKAVIIDFQCSTFSKSITVIIFFNIVKY